MRRMLRHTRLAVLGVALLIAVVAVGVAIATPSSGVTAETYRGNAQGQLNLFTKFSPGVSARIKTKGAFEIVVQKIVAEPGATFGWHYHPGENVNVVAQGTLSLYHAKKCTVEINYADRERLQHVSRRGAPRPQRGDGHADHLRDLPRPEAVAGATASDRPALSGAGLPAVGRHAAQGAGQSGALPAS